jgi:hypothetical protein
MSRVSNLANNVFGPDLTFVSPAAISENTGLNSIQQKAVMSGLHRSGRSKGGRVRCGQFNCGVDICRKRAVGSEARPWNRKMVEYLICDTHNQYRSGCCVVWMNRLAAWSTPS